MIFGNVGRTRIERDMSFDVLLSQCRHAGRNFAVNRDVVDPHFLHRRDQCARFAGMALQKSFSLERGEVLHHRSLAGEMEMALDFTRARGQSFFALLALDEIEDAFLPLSQPYVSIWVAG